jgi:copper chaperone CopZ
MTHTYNIIGMTCGGCKASVEEKLNTLEGVTKVEANVEAHQVTITSSEQFDVETLQQKLPPKYTISKKEERNVFSKTNAVQEEKEASTLKQLFPLFLIFGYIIAASVFLNIKPFNISGFMLDFMGLFYIVFSFFKFLDYKGFPESFKMYDPLAKKLPAYGWVYPFLELALGLLFLTRTEIPSALIITLIILGITTIGVTKALLSKSTIQCACLGTALKLPMTKATFIENSIMIVMAISMLIKLYN